eukprot:COSAG06_NODE_3631_length_5096_cov_5.007004_7_plen_180_part_00
MVKRPPLTTCTLWAIDPANLRSRLTYRRWQLIGRWNHVGVLRRAQWPHARRWAEAGFFREVHGDGLGECRSQVAVVQTFPWGMKPFLTERHLRSLDGLWTIGNYRRIRRARERMLVSVGVVVKKASSEVALREHHVGGLVERGSHTGSRVVGGVLMPSARRRLRQRTEDYRSAENHASP